MSKNQAIKKSIRAFQGVCRSLVGQMEHNEELVDDCEAEIILQAILRVVSIYHYGGILITRDQAARILTSARAFQSPKECHKSSIWLQLAKSDKAGLLSILDFSEGRSCVLD